ncbi:hypothetical protein C4544_07605 [candidate division WS5 bacterium]|uniref:C2H2-type domain-containing protein n=1 Tax=candidate division WS5 bacterium TaxID=2093353 RepID=A0A419D9Y9_9BACT|nr:MAG: hypothetical protein C4544_07605 [candidate division WS5 bacterium]
MKNSIEDIKPACDIKNKSKLSELWRQQINKVRHGSFTCPLCKETFAGIKAFGTHLKDHCT